MSRGKRKRRAGGGSGDTVTATVRAPSTRQAPPPGQGPDRVAAAIAVLGLAISAYLTGSRLFGAALLFCEAGSGCDAVQGSRYGSILGVPTAAFGLLFYGAALALALGPQQPRRHRRLVLLAVAGVAFSAYLTYLEAFVIGAFCGWCVASALVSVALLAAALRHDLPSPGALRALRWPAAGLALLTLVVASLLFELRLPGQTDPYAEGLARHLAKSQAVMYGAFW